MHRIYSRRLTTLAGDQEHPAKSPVIHSVTVSSEQANLQLWTMMNRSLYRFHNLQSNTPREKMQLKQMVKGNRATILI